MWITSAKKCLWPPGYFRAEVVLLFIPEVRNRLRVLPVNFVLFTFVPDTYLDQCPPFLSVLDGHQRVRV
jgi:hypothetical protein